jgi:uncharacterized membrane protein
MSTTSRSLAGVTEGSDATWHKLYSIGGWSGIVIVVPYLAAIVLVAIAPAPSGADGEQTLQYIAAHRWLYGIEQTLWLTPGVLAMIVLLACTSRCDTWTRAMPRSPA